MTYGLLIIPDFKDLSESESRHFRKKRLKLEKRTNLKKLKKGVYLIPFENPEPSMDEIRVFEQIEGLIREFHAKADYFAVTQVEPEHLLEGDPTEIIWECYFILKPIKILQK